MKDLTRKEAGVIGLIADGKKITEIAEETGMAESTINTHLHRVKLKLGAKTATQAAVLFDRKRRTI